MTQYHIVKEALEELKRRDSFGHPFCKQDYESVEKLFRELAKVNNSKVTSRQLVEAYIKSQSNVPINTPTKLEEVEQTEVKPENVEPVEVKPKNVEQAEVKTEVAEKADSKTKNKKK